ncbi:MAG: heme biosynthesis protein HemY [Actinomycetota bacterium]|nr:heme biosynthesis protein HemY [Actinomycetota bacterium]
MDVVIVFEEPDRPSEPYPTKGGRYDRLPKPVRIEDTVATQEASPRPEPNMGRDPERDFMLRYAGAI